MIDKAIEFLQTIMGKTVIGLVLFFILGVLAVFYCDDALVMECEKAEIYLAMERGDNWTRLDMVEWRLDSARMELMKLQSFVEIQQGGNYTDSQKSRIMYLQEQIKKLEIEKSKLINSLNPR